MVGERHGGAQAAAVGQGEGTKDPVEAAVGQGRGAEDPVAEAVGQGRGLDVAVSMVGQGVVAEDQAMAVGRAGASAVDMTTMDSSWVPDGLVMFLLFLGVRFIPTQMAMFAICLMLKFHVLLEEIDTYLSNPFEHYEHVGVDEEGMYLAGSDASSSDSENGNENATAEADSGLDEDDSEYEPEEVEEDNTYDDVEEWVVRDALSEVFPVPIVAYDPNDPPMKVGTMYPSIEEYRLAIAQYSIKHEFEYDIEESEPGRFRASCCVEGCMWRIHASTMQDKLNAGVYVYVM